MDSFGTNVMGSDGGEKEQLRGTNLGTHRHAGCPGRRSFPEVTRKRHRQLGLLFAFGITLSVVHLSSAQFLADDGKQAGPTIFDNRAKPAGTNKQFQCGNPKMLIPGSVSGKHTVSLSWKPSASLSTPVPGDGYNLYRMNPDGSCTKLNAEPIRSTAFQDHYVELGKRYVYSVKAVKHGTESGWSDIIDVAIPSK